MTRLPDISPLEFRAGCKALNPRRPVVFLTYDALDQVLRTTLRRAAETLTDGGAAAVACTAIALTPDPRRI